MINSDDILKANILIVDDVPDNVDILSMLLNVMGYLNVDGTTDPSSVALMYLEKKYDLIILDMQMPGLDGFQVMDRIKEQLSRTGSNDYLPVLAVTGHDNLKISALEAGARDFICRPFDPVELERRIYNFLEVRLLYKQVAQHSKEQEALALHDALTGLPNRRLLEDRLKTALKHASRSGRVVGVLYLDLDGFKQINDTFGHESGDRLLKTVAERLTYLCRREDTIARIGGDEFVVVLADILNTSSVRRLADEFIRSLSQPCLIDDKAVQVSASIGISFYPDDADSSESLLQFADDALYQAKRAGKNRYIFASSMRDGKHISRALHEPQRH